MTVHLVTFASKDMERSSLLCADSSKRQGVDTHARFTPANIGTWKEIKQNAYLFNEKRGCGYWAWKPLIIQKELSWLPDGSTLIYSDAGVEFINNVSHIIERMDQDIFLFGNNWEHAHWCKRDVVEAVWAWPSLSHEQRIAAIERLEARSDRKTLAKLDSLLTSEGEIPDPAWGRFGKQVQASVIFFRVSDYTRQFVAEWLKWCLFEGGRLIDDSPSRLPNHPEFREHRHDQSILTTLSYREGLRLHWWPAVYNRFVPGGPVFTYEKGEYQDDYPPLFHHHRLRNDQWPQHMLTEPTEANRAIALHGTK